MAGGLETASDGIRDCQTDDLSLDFVLARDCPYHRFAVTCIKLVLQISSTKFGLVKARPSMDLSETWTNEDIEVSTWKRPSKLVL